MTRSVGCARGWLGVHRLKLIGKRPGWANYTRQELESGNARLTAAARWLEQFLRDRRFIGRRPDRPHLRRHRAGSRRAFRSHVGVARLRPSDRDAFWPPVVGLLPAGLSG